MIESCGQTWGSDEAGSIVELLATSGASRGTSGGKDKKATKKVASKGGKKDSDQTKKLTLT